MNTSGGSCSEWTGKPNPSVDSDTKSGTSSSGGTCIIYPQNLSAVDSPVELIGDEI